METVISCTTTYNRISLLYHTLISIADQTLKPNLIVVNISKSGYMLDKGITTLPNSFFNLELNLVVNWVENYGSYRKLIPTINNVSDDAIVVTIDDDVIYHPGWFNSLISTSKKCPHSIIAGRARLIKKNFFGAYLNYDGWRMVTHKSEGINLLPIGIDGIAYRRSLLDLNFLNDRHFLEISPRSDDLWFKVASYLKGTSILFDPVIAKGNVYLMHSVGLQEENFNRTRKNRIFMRQVQEINRHVSKYIGLNQSNNDYSWDRIMKYVNSKQIVKFDE